jgi:hypothetical protein
VSRLFRLLLPTLAAALAAVTLVACGSDSPSSAGDGSSDEEKQLAFQDCLRKEGLDVQISGDGRGIAIGSRADADASGSAPDANRAMEKCRKSTGWAPKEPSDAEKSEMRDRGLRFARCMREHGVDMDDPAPDGRMTLRVQGDSPTFRAAQKACGAMMGGPGGPGGPGEDGGESDFSAAP